MTTGIFDGLADLRFDASLNSFQDLVTYWIDSNDRGKTSGKKIAAKSPLTPAEPILAGGALPFDLLNHENMVHSILKGHTNLHHQAVEAGISPEFDPWNLVMLGSVLSDSSSPVFNMMTAALGGFDDQLTKSFQIASRAKSLPLRFWEVPRYEPEAEKWALSFLEQELKQLFNWIQHETGNRIDDEKLSESIHNCNLVRQDMLTLNSYLSGSIIPIPALEYYIVQMLTGDCGMDPLAFHNKFAGMLNELKSRIDSGFTIPNVVSSPVRVYICGNESQELSLFNAIEDYGGCLVGCDFMLPAYYRLIDENNSPLRSLADWVWRMPNNMSISQRLEAEVEAIKMQKPDAVIICSLVGSRSIPGAERMVRDTVRESLSLPTLSIETTLPRENTEKIDYQVRAFMEMVR